MYEEYGDGGVGEGRSKVGTLDKRGNDDRQALQPLPDRCAPCKTNPITDRQQHE